MNALFIDFIEGNEKARPFYPSREHPRSVDVPHRAALCEILRKQNEHFGNAAAAPLLDKLARPDTCCVITGQQVGLLTGPLYTIWKALTTLKYARTFEEQRGIPCVPVFWMATEDHNWHEVMNFSILREDRTVASFSLKDHLFLKKQPTGSVPVGHEEVRKILLRAFRELKAPEVQEFYAQGTLTDGFARTLLRVLREFPMLLIDPSDPEIKKLGAPFFARFFERKDTMMQLLAQQNDRLRSCNYPEQVRMEENVLPLFRIENGERRHVPNTDAAREIPVQQLSPSALLRPLFQDFLFPTIGYTGGPAEIAYFAQLGPWYGAMEIEQPWVLPRASLTLIPPATASFLNSRRLQPDELFLKEDTLADALINHSDLDQMRRGLKDIRENALNGLEQIKQSAQNIDPSLKKMMETSERKIRYQMEKMSRKAFLAIKNKDQVLLEHIRKARNVIYPEDKLQERAINILSFASLLPDLMQDVYRSIALDSRAHLWLKI